MEKGPALLALEGGDQGEVAGVEIEVQGAREALEPPGDVRAPAGVGKSLGQGGEEPAGGRRQPPEPLGEDHPPMALVPGRHLVAAETREGDGDVRARHLRQVPVGNRRGIGERLVEGADDARNHRFQIRAHDELVVLGRVALGHGAGIEPLVVMLSPVLVADREGLDRPRGVPRHERDDRSRIDAAGEKGAERHVGHHADPHRLVEEGAKRIDRRRRSPGLVRNVAELPVRLAADLAVLDDEEMGRLELLDPREDGERGGHVEVGQEVIEPGRREPPLDARVAQETLELRAPEELPPGDGEEELLHPHPVPRQDEPPPGPVPDGDREHPAQLLDAARSVLLVGVNDDLGVGAGAEPMPALLQVLAQLLEVVDLPVEGHPRRLVLVGDRLAAGGQVDDLEPAHGEAHPPGLDVEAVLVRPAMGDDAVHLGEERTRDGSPCALVEVQDAGDATHAAWPAFGSRRAGAPLSAARVPR